MELPSLDRWEVRLRELSSEQRERIESPEFCEFLRTLLGQRFLALKQ